MYDYAIRHSYDDDDDDYIVAVLKALVSKLCSPYCSLYK